MEGMLFLLLAWFSKNHQHPICKTSVLVLTIFAILRVLFFGGGKTGNFPKRVFDSEIPSFLPMALFGEFVHDFPYENINVPKQEMEMLWSGSLQVGGLDGSVV